MATAFAQPSGSHSKHHLGPLHLDPNQPLKTAQTVTTTPPVSLPLTGSQLEKWTRFATKKGGIGRATATKDRLAEEEGELMFMPGEEIVVVLDLGEGSYLGYCEGVMGRFDGSDVQFHGKLKKPVFTKRPRAPTISSTAPPPLPQHLTAATSLPTSDPSSSSSTNAASEPPESFTSPTLTATPHMSPKPPTLRQTSDSRILQIIDEAASTDLPYRSTSPSKTPPPHGKDDDADQIHSNSRDMTRSYDDRNVRSGTLSRSSNVSGSGGPEQDRARPTPIRSPSGSYPARPPSTSSTSSPNRPVRSVSAMSSVSTGTEISVRTIPDGQASFDLYALVQQVKPDPKTTREGGDVFGGSGGDGRDRNGELDQEEVLRPLNAKKANRRGHVGAEYEDPGRSGNGNGSRWESRDSATTALATPARRSNDSARTNEAVLSALGQTSHQALTSPSPESLPSSASPSTPHDSPPRSSGEFMRSKPVMPSVPSLSRGLSFDPSESPKMDGSPGQTDEARGEDIFDYYANRFSTASSFGQNLATGGNTGNRASIAPSETRRSRAYGKPPPRSTALPDFASHKSSGSLSNLAGLAPRTEEGDTSVQSLSVEPLIPTSPSSVVLHSTQILEGVEEPSTKREGSRRVPEPLDLSAAAVNLATSLRLQMEEKKKSPALQESSPPPGPGTSADATRNLDPDPFTVSRSSTAETRVRDRVPSDSNWLDTSGRHPPRRQSGQLSSSRSAPHLTLQHPTPSLDRVRDPDNAFQPPLASPSPISSSTSRRLVASPEPIPQLNHLNPLSNSTRSGESPFSSSSSFVSETSNADNSGGVPAVASPTGPTRRPSLRARATSALAKVGFTDAAFALANGPASSQSGDHVVNQNINSNSRRSPAPVTASRPSFTGSSRPSISGPVSPPVHTSGLGLGLRPSFDLASAGFTSNGLPSSPSGKGISHSSSTSSLPAVLRTPLQLPESLPTASKFDTEEVIKMGGDEFEIIKPAAGYDSSSSDLDLPGSSVARPPRASQDRQRSRSFTSTRRTQPSEDFDDLSDAETDDEVGPAVVRPSTSARERARAEYEAENGQLEGIDENGFFIDRAKTPALPARDLHDPATVEALERHRAKETQWLSIMSGLTVANVKKSKKMKRLVRNGIPNSVRGKAWGFLAETASFRVQGLYGDLCGRPRLEVFDEIEKDLDRCYPDHSHFRDPDAPGRLDLASVLKAFAHHEPAIGYCQGLGLIAGCLLLHAPAEDAFWLLVAIATRYLKGYFTQDMAGFRVDAFILGQLVEVTDSKLAKKLAENDIHPTMYAAGWLLPMFTRTLPWACTLRVFDCFLFEGTKFLLRIALAIFDVSRSYLMDPVECPTQTEMLEYLLHLPKEDLGANVLFPSAFTIKIKDSALRRLTRRGEVFVREGEVVEGRFSRLRGKGRR